MSQPFAALLLNGCKTVESRNNPMLADVEPGTRVLIHCGHRDWRDVESYKHYLPSRREDGEGEDDSDVAKLRWGFARGTIVGAVTVGRTWRASESERGRRELQRRVLAPEQDIGRYCTEILDATWLRRPHKVRGSPGVFEVEIPKDCLPR
jgi:hypothetical protein